MGVRSFCHAGGPAVCAVAGIPKIAIAAATARRVPRNSSLRGMFQFPPILLLTNVPTKRCAMPLAALRPCGLGFREPSLQFEFENLEARGSGVADRSRHAGVLPIE